MSKLTTADCTKFLATDPKIQQLAKDRYDWDNDDYDDESRKYAAKVIIDAADPKKWKRRNKYKIGSKADMDGGAGEYSGMRYGENPEYAGGIVRIFWLQDSDHITVALLELDGKLKLIDDLSD